jgi:Zn-dependent protease
VRQPAVRTFSRYTHDESRLKLKDYVFREPPLPPPYVLEGLDRLRPRRIVRLLGVDWMVSGTAWFAPIWIVGLGIAISLVAQVRDSTSEGLLIGLVFGLLVAGSMVVHQLGGIIAGTLVKAPMLEVVFTGTLAYDVYQESEGYSKLVHVVRGLGGPAANLGLGLLMLALYFSGYRSPLVLFLGILNVIFCLAALMPLPTMDGGIILKNLRGSKSIKTLAVPVGRRSPR